MYIQVNISWCLRRNRLTINVVVSPSDQVLQSVQITDFHIAYVLIWLTAAAQISPGSALAILVPATML